MAKFSNNLKIKLGLIGLGNIGLIHFDVLENLSSDGHIFLIAIADPNPKKQIEDVLYFKDYRELLKSNKINAVSIATPPNTHYQIAYDALNLGKHVLLEKPPTSTIKELEEISILAKDKGLVLFTAYHTRYRPEIETAAKELSNKEVKKIKIEYKEYVLNYHDADGWIFNPDIAGGGVLIDSGINAISVVRYISPNIDFKIKDVELKRATNFKVETSAKVEFSFGKNREGFLDMDWLYKGKEIRKIIFYTDKDEYLIDIVQGQLIKNGSVITGDTSSKRMKADLNIEYAGVYHDFINHFQKRESLVSMKELKFVLDAYKKSDVENKF